MVAVPDAVRPLLERIGRLAQEQAVEVYAVGGCVRDWWLNVPKVTDLDVAVVGDGIAFARAAAAALQAGVKPHEQFGTATLDLPAQPASRQRRRGQTPEVFRIDIATCRKETYAKPAAYPRVSRSALSDDLFRRDFTINAMAMELVPGRFGRLVDPFNGRADLARAQLRILHDRSFIDDPSRILRAARFAQRYELQLEPGTGRCLRRALGDGVLGKLNRGRLRKELDRMVDEPDPVACLVRLGRWLSGDVA
ncbi:MAG: CCA tRNA nucleotidyltransferase [Candidatus Omnitrophica bacterium]|nr:CCA tRNA nucleotidyltransferase [Candidatus Omnitrophota bacterium]